METIDAGRVWLTRQDVADRFGVPVTTVAQWAYLGKGPRFAKFGKYARYLLADVLAWEDEQFVGGVA
jgi:hypothetical protein